MARMAPSSLLLLLVRSNKMVHSNAVKKLHSIDAGDSSNLTLRQLAILMDI